MFDFFISHSQILLRSSKGDTDKTNIDVVFFGVKFLQIATHLKGIELRTSEGEDFFAEVENNLFEIIANNKKYYIDAAYVKVYENELDFNESCLGVLKHKGRDLELASSI